MEENLDSNDVVKWRNNPLILKWMFKKKQIELNDHIEWFKNKKNRLDFIIIDKKLNKSIGTVNFTFLSEKEAEAGKLIGDLNYWGKGYAKEAFNIWINYGFLNLSLKRIIVKSKVDNFGNIALNKKLGFDILKTDNNIVTMILDKNDK